MKSKSILRASDNWEEKHPIYTKNSQTPSQLDYSYFWSLVFSGILFLAALGQLGWCSGIGWVFFSRFLSIFLVRWDISKNGGNNTMLWIEKNNNDQFINYLN